MLVINSSVAAFLTSNVYSVFVLKAAYDLNSVNCLYATSPNSLTPFEVDNVIFNCGLPGDKLIKRTPAVLSKRTNDFSLTIIDSGAVASPPRNNVKISPLLTAVDFAVL